MLKKQAELPIYV